MLNKELKSVNPVSTVRDILTRKTSPESLTGRFDRHNARCRAKGLHKVKDLSGCAYPAGYPA